MRRLNLRPGAARAGGTALLLLLIGASGCGRSGSGDAAAVPRSPKEAATQVDAVFKEAAPEVREKAVEAADAMRQGDLEKAVVSLQTVRSREGLTLQQGVALHHSMIALESQLISAIEAGDPNAKRAYELLKRIKRDR